MQMRMRMAGLWAATVLAMATSCTKQERGGGTGEHPRPSPITGDTPPQVTAVLSAVTLADDCAHADATRPAEAKRRAPDDADRSMTEGESQARSCTQSSLQLTLTGTNGGKTGRAEVKLLRVELIDTATGKSLGQLTPRNPRLWADAVGAYQVWDQTIANLQQAKVMFDLSAPDYSQIGGRWNAPGKVFRLQATISASGAESTTTKEVSIEAPEVMVDPMIET
ncbi:MAG: hypothetical protein IT370_06490 [Deltaproteobacteria bacterium]|nr:hypothetical protein [Deltaproteobacteria bacterium]